MKAKLLKCEINVDSGQSIGHAIVQAIECSVNLNTNVSFVFNSEKWTVNLLDLIACAKKEIKE